jgi:hypothetical protein
MEMKNKGAPERDGWLGKGNNQERHGELELTMASSNNCKGERQ